MAVCRSHKDDPTAYKRFLKADQTDWLLEKDDLSVRYFALKELLDKPEDTPEGDQGEGVPVGLLKARAAIGGAVQYSRRSLGKGMTG